jgi:hypothetical protein
MASVEVPTVPKRKDPTVPKRKDPAALEPYAKSQSTRAENQDPRFQYEWFRIDQLEEKLRRHEIGDQTTGYLMVEPWEHVTDDQGIVTGRGPAADGKPLDTRIRKGDLWLLRTPKENHAKYARIEQIRDGLITDRLVKGERHTVGKNSRIQTRVVGGHDGLDADVNNMAFGGVG